MGITGGCGVHEPKSTGIAIGICTTAMAAPMLDYDGQIRGGIEALHASTALGRSALSFYEAHNEEGFYEANNEEEIQKSDRFQRGAFGRSTDTKWSCSIKNSFLHIQAERGEGDQQQVVGKPHRSASVPIRMDLWELPESLDTWHISNVSGWWNHRHPEMGRLDFEWGYPGKRQLPVVEVHSSEQDLGKGSSLELSQILTFDLKVLASADIETPSLRA